MIYVRFHLDCHCVCHWGPRRGGGEKVGWYFFMQPPALVKRPRLGRCTGQYKASRQTQPATEKDAALWNRVVPASNRGNNDSVPFVCTTMPGRAVCCTLVLVVVVGWKIANNSNHSVRVNPGSGSNDNDDDDMAPSNGRRMDDRRGFGLNTRAYKK